MIRFRTESFAQDRWAGIVAPFRDLSLLQCWEYGAAKQAVEGWHVERGVFVDGDEVLGAAQVMVRAVPVVGGGLAWVSRGPLWRPADGRRGRSQAAIFEDALAEMNRHYVAERGMYLRIAPPITADDPASAAFGPAGFDVTDTPGWASALVDLRQPEEALRKGLRRNWRTALNNAERTAIRIDRVTTGAAFDGFLDEYRDFLAARRIATGITPQFLRALQSHLSRGGGLVCYRGTHEGVALGSVLIVRYGDCAEFLAGTLLDAGRPLNAGQLMLWRALCDARADGAARFDLGGMDSERTPKGIYDFKAGLGGRPYRLAPEIEVRSRRVRARLVRWRVEHARRAGGGGA